jgi:diacylglycerol kinase family enzyme
VTPDPNFSTTFFIHDLYDEKERSVAFEEAKKKCKVSDFVYIIICGGDGTVEWVI